MSQVNNDHDQALQQKRDPGLGGSASPLITTIIPTYRRPKLLRRAISSVLSQTYTNFQVSVYDNASGDETASVVAEMAERDLRVKYYCHAENIGSMKNFNFALGRVDTPFFSFLSDDDLILPDFYQSAVPEFDRFPDAAFYSGAAIHMTESGKVQHVSPRWPSEGYQEPPEGVFTMLHKRLTWTSVLFRSEVLKDIGGLDPKVGAPSDLDFLLRIAARYPFVVTSKPVAIYLDHPGSHSAVIDLEYTWPALLHMTRNLTDDTRIPIETRQRVHKVFTADTIQRLFFVGGNAVRIRKFAEAREIANILRTRYDRRGYASIISTTAWCCEHIPFAHAAFLFVNRLRKVPRYGKMKSLQERFGHYARYLSYS